MKILAGDFRAGCDVRFAGDRLQVQKGFFRYEYIPLSDIAAWDFITEDNRASILGKVGWGAIGAVALGPLGLLAGVIGGGNKRDRVMAIETRYGQRFLLKGSAGDVEKFHAALFSARPKPPREIDGAPRDRIEPPTLNGSWN